MNEGDEEVGTVRHWMRRVDPAAWLIVLFWLGQYSLLTASRAILIAEEKSGWPWSEIQLLVPRALTNLTGMAISFAILRWLRRRPSPTWTHRLLEVIVLAMIGAFLHAATNFLIFQIFIGEENLAAATVASYTASTIQWFWGYCAISAMLAAVVYSGEVLESERRLGEFRALAHNAQLLALRYQLQPHFMFNTLNSIASLISAGESDRAEQMVENLSDFLRASLATEPGDDLPLEQEIHLQSLYLAIEAVRFPERLHVEIDVGPRMEGVTVPSLILQPLVENAVKHGVSRSAQPVSVRITARAEGGRARLTVWNDVPARSTANSRGESIGLTNVARRLEVRYGDSCGFTAGPENGGFRVSFLVPKERS